jgi:hypothetical protein
MLSISGSRRIVEMNDRMGALSRRRFVRGAAATAGAGAAVAAVTAAPPSAGRLRARDRADDYGRDGRSKQSRPGAPGTMKVGVGLRSWHRAIHGTPGCSSSTVSGSARRPSRSAALHGLGRDQVADLLRRRGVESTEGRIAVQVFGGAL